MIPPVPGVFLPHPGWGCQSPPHYYGFLLRLASLPPGLQHQRTPSVALRYFQWVNARKTDSRGGAETQRTGGMRENDIGAQAQTRRNSE